MTTGRMNLCLGCIYLNRSSEKPSCDAFEVIPDSIFYGGRDHRNPIKGDNGITFKEDPEKQGYEEKYNKFQREISQ